MKPSPQELVERFYHQVWNRADEGAARDLLAADFRFRGSLGPERRGPDGFIDYMRSVHAALGGYRIEIEDLIAAEERAAARIRSAGRHRAPFFGVDATGREIVWAAAAFFTMEAGRIAALWVLGDVETVKRQLGAPENATF